MSHVERLSTLIQIDLLKTRRVGKQDLVERISFQEFGAFKRWAGEHLEDLLDGKIVNWKGSKLMLVRYEIAHFV